MNKQNIEQFLITWGIILFLNQLFLFGGCFNPVCIGAALPHTGIIAWFVMLWNKKDNDDTSEEIDDFDYRIKPKKWEPKIRPKNPQQPFKKKKTDKKHPSHKDWDSNCLHKKTRVHYLKFEFDINGWSIEKIYLPYSNTDEYININTGDKYNRAGVDYYGNKKIIVKKKSQRANTYNDFPKTEESFTKKFGDDYERYIGKKFEDKGDLVIYNGFIKGYEDKGVDIIAISQQTKVIDLIQCKNWVKKEMVLDDIENIHHKLSIYQLDFFDLNINDINTHLHYKLDQTMIKNMFLTIKLDPKRYKIRKSLYASSDKVIDLEIGKHLTYIKSNIFRFQDMKIVIHKPNAFR